MWSLLGTVPPQKRAKEPLEAHIQKLLGPQDPWARPFRPFGTPGPHPRPRSLMPFRLLGRVPSLRLLGPLVPGGPGLGTRECFIIRSAQGHPSPCSQTNQQPLSHLFPLFLHEVMRTKRSPKGAGTQGSIVSKYQPKSNNLDQRPTDKSERPRTSGQGPRVRDPWTRAQDPGLPSAWDQGGRAQGQGG